MQPFNFCRESIAAIMSFSCKDLWRVPGRQVGAKRESKAAQVIVLGLHWPISKSTNWAALTWLPRGYASAGRELV